MCQRGLKGDGAQNFSATEDLETGSTRKSLSRTQSQSGPHRIVITFLRLVLRDRTERCVLVA